MEGAGGGDRRKWLQSGYQESEWEEGSGAAAARRAGGEYTEKREKNYGIDVGNQAIPGQPKRYSKLKSLKEIHAFRNITIKLGAFFW